MQMILSSSRLLHVWILLLFLSLPQVAFSDKSRTPVTVSTTTKNSICDNGVQLKVSLAAISDPVCHSKGFLYQGGPCSSEAVAANICRDYYQYDTNEVIYNGEAFLLVTNVHNSSVIYYSGYVEANSNNHAMITLKAATSSGKEDEFLPEQLSVQVFTDKSMKEILQSMIVPAPCFLEETALNLKVLPDTPVRLAFTAHQPSVRTYRVSLEERDIGSKGDSRLESLKVIKRIKEHELQQELNDELHALLPFQTEFEISLKEDEYVIVVAKLLKSTTDSYSLYCFLETQLEEDHNKAGESVTVTAF